MAARIEDHGIIGDGRSSALVSVEGAIDWLCWPRFDSPPLFAGLLDRAAGRWQVKPRGADAGRQRYLPGTNVLETRFEAGTGSVVVTDLMTVASDAEQRALLTPEHEILRLVRCERGEADVDVVLDVRPNFGRGKVLAIRTNSWGVRIETDQGLLVLRSSGPLRVQDDGSVRGSQRLRAGDVLELVLTYSGDFPAVLTPLGSPAQDALARTVRFWRSWLAQLTYDGPQRAAVERSALLLKLLVYAPSGAILAAPTTSLPERLGGTLNWDYRYCWLRDAALTARALYGLGIRAEADAFVSWLLHSTRLTQPMLNVLYDVYGKSPPDEYELEELRGYAGSRPVRVGNAAKDQLQLDVYGEVIDAVARAVGEGGRIDSETERMLEAFGSYVCHHWPEPDEGIWEPRSGRHHNTHSRVLCWVALDRLLELERRGHVRHISAERFAANREMLRAEIEQRAFNPHLGSYVSQLGGDQLDASLLLLPWYGFEPATSPRMVGTYRTVRRRLGAGGQLLYRYRDVAPEMRGVLEEEGAFGICSFWGVEYLALGGGSHAEALEAFDELCGLANPVGLFAEEFDPSSRTALGNFPQGFTHVGLVNAALSLARRASGEPCDGGLRP